MRKILSLLLYIIVPILELKLLLYIVLLYLLFYFNLSFNRGGSGYISCRGIVIINILFINFVFFFKKFNIITYLWVMPEIQKFRQGDWEIIGSPLISVVEQYVWCYNSQLLNTGSHIFGTYVVVGWMISNHGNHAKECFCNRYNLDSGWMMNVLISQWCVKRKITFDVCRHLFE